ncbi:hypothetical protein FBALC1_04072 [Flavobacteriales bacterium ALC-1]|nr:hypothetical protein FBALC1_04072 [Flavobacteriales bacterium ALC-1]
MNCKNCYKTLNDTQRFCDECGAKVIQNRLTPKVLATQVNEEFISIDNKFLRTFVNLLKKPEDVINGYIDGTRKKYINVIQYFAIALTVAGIHFFLMKTFFMDQFESAFQIIDPNVDNTEFMMNYQKALNDIAGSGNNFQSLIYILSVPFSAIGTWIAYNFTGTKVYNFTEHIVINLYYYGQSIIISSLFSIFGYIVGINMAISATIVMLLIMIYQFYVFKRVTGHGTIETIAKVILSYIILGLQVLILLILLIIIVVLLKAINII